MTEMFSVQLAVNAVGSAILHSFWQGALVGILTALALRALQGSTANVRYAVACLGLATFTLAWLTTAIDSANSVDASQPAALTTYSDPAPSEIMGPGTTSSFPVSGVASNAAASLAPWTERLESWSRAVVPLWFVGVLVLSIRLAFGWREVRRIRRPACWWISKQIRAEREHCCDDIAVSVCATVSSMRRRLLISRRFAAGPRRSAWPPPMAF